MFHSSIACSSIHYFQDMAISEGESPKGARMDLQDASMRYATLCRSVDIVDELQPLEQAILQEIARRAAAVPQEGIQR